MLVPTSATAGLLLMILALVCWGTWANTLKTAGKWRYELYFFDFAIGLVVCAAVAAFTLGSFNPGELTFQDNLLIASTRKMAYAAGAGVLFSLGNVLLMGGIASGGMSVAFPVSLGLATVIAGGWSFAFNQEGSPFLLFAGVILLIAAMLAIAFAKISHVDARAEAGRQAALQVDPRTKVRRKQGPTPALAIALSAASGVLLGVYRPILDIVRDGENGVGAYGTALIFAGGALLGTLFFSPFVINFPATGEPVTFRSYFTSTAKQHLLGLSGGILWGVGAVAAWVVTGSAAAAQMSPIARYALAQGAPLIALLCGLAVWKEFEETSDRVRALLWAGVVLYLLGLALMSTSGFAGTK